MRFETVMLEAASPDLHKTSLIYNSLVSLPLAGLQPVPYEYIMDHGFLLVSGHLSRSKSQCAGLCTAFSVKTNLVEMQRNYKAAVATAVDSRL